MSASILTAISSTKVFCFRKNKVSSQGVAIILLAVSASLFMHLDNESFFFFRHFLLIVFNRLLPKIAITTIAPPINAPLPGMMPEARNTQRGLRSGSSTGMSIDSSAVTC